MLDGEPASGRLRVAVIAPENVLGTAIRSALEASALVELVADAASAEAILVEPDGGREPAALAAATGAAVLTLGVEIPLDVAPEQLPEALRLAVDGTPRAVAARPRAEPETPGPAGLTPRELEVLRAAAHGRTNREIAAELRLSEHAVKSHMSRIYRKLQLRSRVEATGWLVANSLLD
jgi:DNA-binding CsgD family transcriptional regulator